jgi:predicted metal-binding membrane protein
MGLHHGYYCLGCCWFLMALLFVGGVMNLYWIIGLAVFVLVEKSLGGGRRLTRISGGLLILGGIAMLTGFF